MGIMGHRNCVATPHNFSQNFLRTGDELATAPVARALACLLFDDQGKAGQSERRLPCLQGFPDPPILKRHVAEILNNLTVEIVRL
jgi:hypothetical protein